MQQILRTGCNQNSHGGELCNYLFAYLGPEGTDIGETYIGVLLLAISLCMLCGCLIGMVKVLNALLGSKVKGIIENVINADIPVKGLGWLTGYLAMVVGAIMTILVQSSSVFTSTLTPLAGAGLVSLERAYPLTLGANLGTTTTSILASFAAGGENIQAALQISLVHLFFNLSGILLFYPVPCMRWPISIARVLGNTTSQYRWFAVLYLCFMFFIFPLSMFGLSMAGPIPIYLVIILLLIVIIFAVTVSNLQISHPSLLPTLLQNWDFLPLWLHSLDPWDELVMTAIGCCCRKKGWDDEQLKEVMINRETPEDAVFPSVVYSNHPISKNNPKTPNFKFAFTGVAYNRLPATASASATPSPRSTTPIETPQSDNIEHEK